VDVSRIHQVDLVCESLAPAAAAAPTAAPAAPAAAGPNVPTLSGGTGFTAATAQPAAIGTGAGSAQNPMARWDVVPHQTISGRFPLGVVAFHINGIDRVEFSLNGGTWLSVSDMTENSVTHVVEYCAAIDASALADGEYEVRAVAYPKVGVPRVLDPLLVEVAADRSKDVSMWVDATNGSDVTMQPGPAQQGGPPI